MGAGSLGGAGAGGAGAFGGAQPPKQLGLPRRPPSAVGAPRPMSEYAREMINLGDQNPRWRHDNILVTELDVEHRSPVLLHDVASVTEYGVGEGGGQHPRLEKFVQLALKEDDLDSVVYRGEFGGGEPQGSRAARRSRIDSQSAGDESPEPAKPAVNYPQARGLVR